MRAASAAALVAALLVAGCLGGPEPTESLTASSSNASVQIGERPDTSFTEDIAVGAVAAPDLDASLDAAPELIPGEWWRIKFRSPLSGAEVEYVRVVAAVDETEGGRTYVFGMPHEGWYKEAVLYHTPAFGDVSASDLSYNTHDVLFQPLRFPLEDGDSWTTSFSGGPEITATVSTNPTERTADVTFVAPNGATVLQLTYDAKQHEVVKFLHNTVEYEVLEHGYDFEGWVTVPRGEDLVFLHGRVAGAIGAGGQGPSPVPRESVEIAGGFNRLTFFQATFPIAGPGLHAGVYRTVATSPNGTVYETMSLPTDQGFVMNIFEYADPDGTWELEHEAAGPGVAFIEGIAYHQYDIRLPDGARRSDHSHEVIR